MTEATTTHEPRRLSGRPARPAQEFAPLRVDEAPTDAPDGRLLSLSFVIPVKDEESNPGNPPTAHRSRMRGMGGHRGDLRG